MSRGPKTAAVVLTNEERSELQRLVRRCGAGQAAVMRTRIVLTADAEPKATSQAVAVRLRISRQSVITWPQRFLAHRLEGLVDAPRSGEDHGSGDEVVEALIVRTLETQPAGQRIGRRALWLGRSA